MFQVREDVAVRTMRGLCSVGYEAFSVGTSTSHSMAGDTAFRLAEEYASLFAEWGACTGFAAPKTSLHTSTEFLLNQGDYAGCIVPRIRR